jgi:hypothetical protein
MTNNPTTKQTLTLIFSIAFINAQTHNKEKQTNNTTNKKSFINAYTQKQNQHLKAFFNAHTQKQNKQLKAFFNAHTQKQNK